MIPAAAIPTTDVTCPRGHDSSCSRMMIQARMNGAAAAANSSQRLMVCTWKYEHVWSPQTPPLPVSSVALGFCGWAS